MWDMLTITARSPLEDIEFLARSEHRVTALAALARRPQSRADLLEKTKASPSTIGRTLREFEKRQWISKDGNNFEATELGRFVASGMQDLIKLVDTEQRLRDVWHWLPTEASDFTIEMAADAVVTDAKANDPYGPVNRFVSLLEETDHFRFVGYDVPLLEPCKDVLRQQILDGMQTEVIDPPKAAKYILSTYEEHCSEALESGNLTVRVHEALPPYGISLFDDRIAVSCYNPDSGTAQVLLDTDAPEAREWAESTYESYRREAELLTLDTAVE